jgi:sulfide:quinone oxidoreductase
MEVKRLAQELSVSPQIMPADVAALKIAGFSSIICNRPDGEARTAGCRRRERSGV